MTDIGEERRLRAIDLRQHIRALAFAFVGAGVDDRCRDRRSEQFQETPERVIEWQTRTHPRHKNRDRPLCIGNVDWKKQRTLRRFRIWPTREGAETRFQIGQLDRRICPRHVRERPRDGRVVQQIDDRLCDHRRLWTGLSNEPGLVTLEQIELRERNIQSEFRERLRRERERLGGCLRLASSRREIAQRLRPTFRKHLRRGLRHGMKQSTDSPALIPNRTE